MHGVHVAPLDMIDFLCMSAAESRECVAVNKHCKECSTEWMLGLHSFIEVGLSGGSTRPVQ
jgi:hypothetical protein